MHRPQPGVALCIITQQWLLYRDVHALLFCIVLRRRNAPLNRRPIAVRARARITTLFTDVHQGKRCREVNVLLFCVAIRRKNAVLSRIPTAVTTCACIAIHRRDALLRRVPPVVAGSALHILLLGEGVRRA